ncbi:MAG: hypothetical protein Ct9H300mP3_07180 [Gammaproteobacteria bacterium]|nr:MAG: hypothetical protein Ct9H300mP3_07180 [Gammaproteobacteria bacterium]
MELPSNCLDYAHWSLCKKASGDGNITSCGYSFSRRSITVFLLFYDSLIDRLTPWSRSSSFPKEYETLQVAEISDVPLLLGMNEFWIGIGLGAIFVFLTIYFRSKSDYASVE